VKKIIAAAATIIALAACATTTVSASAAPAAPAERTPVMYSGMGTAWTNPARRPHSFVLGADFEVVKMSWSQWTNTGAFGRGHLVACAGAAGPCAKFVAGVTLSTVKTHDGTRYFASMKLTGKHRKTQRLKMHDGSWLLVTKGYGS
jgi:hypothetical protein